MNEKFAMTSKNGSSFKIVNSNDLSVLASVCAYIIKSHPLSDVLAHENVLVMNSGMQTYLSQEIALKNDVCAGINWSQIWIFIWDLYKKLFKVEDKLNRFSRDSMAWSLLGLKDTWSCSKDGDTDLIKRYKSIFEPLKNYVKDEAFAENDSGIMAWDLCFRIADTFDQYQMNRPEWIRAWNKLSYEDFDRYVQDPSFRGKVYDVLLKESPNFNKVATLTDPDLQAISKGSVIAPQVKANDWQPLLWLMLKKNLKGYETYQSKKDKPFAYKDRVEILDDLKELLDKGSLDPVQKRAIPERLFIMGVSSMPEQVMDFFRILGKHADVYLLLINPCRDYWGDIDNSKKALAEIRSRMRTSDPLSLIKHELGEDTLLDLSESQNIENLRYGDNGELEGGNALLTALGRQGRDILSLLVKPNEAPDFINCFVKPQGRDVLSCIKRNLLTLDDAEVSEIEDGDNSLIFCSCHTQTREIEVLRDSILQKFKEAKDAGEELLPRDILVMTPNIEQYAAQIEAVFGSIDRKSPNYIPYSIGDRTVDRESPVTSAILKLLDIGNTPVTLSFIISLLQIPEIALSFDITTDDAQIISNWCMEANARWGLDEVEANDEASVKDIPWTFKKAISRMIKGAMIGEDVDECGELYDSIEGSDLNLLGRFENFITKLIEIRDLFTKNKDQDLRLDQRSYQINDSENIEEELATQDRPMIEVLGEFFRDFIKNCDGENRAAEFIRTLGGMTKILPELGNRPKITLRVLASMLSNAFAAKVDENSYLRGKVNFCSLMPMRAVPFKHIFILGLNDGDFPRKERSPGFNLITLRPFFRRGDRSRSVDDRYLFLEAILSAQKSITFSYIGCDPVDKSVRNPSAVISELWDYLNDNFKVKALDAEVKEILPSKRLTYEARLNSYDMDNFINKTGSATVSRLPSFDAGAFIEDNEKKKDPSKQIVSNENDKEIVPSKLSTIVNEALCPLGFEITGVDLPERLNITASMLLNFLKSPCKLYLSQRDISIRNDDDELVDVEQFEPDFLEDKALKARLIASNDDDEIEDVIAKLRASGRLPYGLFGEHCAKDLMKVRADVRDALKPLSPVFEIEDYINPQSIEFNHRLLTFNKRRDLGLDADGDITVVFSGQALFPALHLDLYHKDFKSPSPKTLFSLMVQALSQGLCDESTHHPQALSCVALASGLTGKFQPFTHDEAQECLRVCVKWYLMGLIRPLPIWVDALKNFLKKTRGGASWTVDDFKYDLSAAFIFRDKSCVDESINSDDSLDNDSLAINVLYELRKSFIEELYIPYVLRHCDKELIDPTKVADFVSESN